MSAERIADCYKRVMKELEFFYCETPNRRYFQIALADTLTQEEALAWLCFPKHTEAVRSLSEVEAAYEKDSASNPEAAEPRTPFDQITISLTEKNFLIPATDQAGNPSYVRNFLYGIGRGYAVTPALSESMLSMAFQDWFHCMCLGGKTHLRFPDEESLGVFTKETAEQWAPAARERDVYDEVMEELEFFYGETPNRCYFRYSLMETLTPEECEVWLLFPKHTEEPEPVSLIAKKDAGAHENIAEIAKSIENKFFITDWDEVNGEHRYVRNYIFKYGITYAEIPDLVNHPSAIFFQDWFQAMVEGCSANLPFPEGEFRVVPNEIALGKEPEESREVDLSIEIPDTRETVPFDYVTELIKKQDVICLTTCNCRVNKDAMGTRECDYPIETCMLCGDLGARTLAVGAGRRISVEEALEITKRGRDLGLVHNVSNAKDPSVICQCCACCCLVLKSVFRGEHTNGEKSRFIASVDQSKLDPAEAPFIASKCPAGAMQAMGNKLVMHGEKCIGCGICKANCKSGAISLNLRGGKGSEIPKEDHLDFLYL